MMRQTGALAELIAALRRLPGIGPKSAQRMALHLLQRDRAAARRLGDSIRGALERVRLCADCNILTEGDLCEVCTNPTRDRSQLCIVETPADVYAIDEAISYKGLYFVLNGRLSPLDGIGPGELGMDRLEHRFASGEVREVILATNATVEGEATAHYISEMARHRQIRATRIAHGVPFGGELEYVDGTTLSHAFNGRREL
jgi:recombination protein RecR